MRVVLEQLVPPPSLLSMNSELIYVNLCSVICSKSQCQVSCLYLICKGWHDFLPNLPTLCLLDLLHGAFQISVSFEESPRNLSVAHQLLPSDLKDRSSSGSFGHTFLMAVSPHSAQIWQWVEEILITVWALLTCTPHTSI